MEDKNLIENATLKHTRTYKEIEIAGYYSGTFDFETNQLIGRKTKALIAALLGTVVEWYDYALYGYMAVVLSNHFFPNTDPSTALLKHFLVFALGFLARPLGASIFGRIGDLYGRKCALRWSIIGIALPTVTIGLLPSYNQVGITAVILLCLCRFTQGLFISAEIDGINIFIYETLPKKRAGLLSSLNWVSPCLGISLASFASGLALLPQSPSWAWRLPFLFAGVLGLVTLWLRKYLIESYDYIVFKERSQLSDHKTFCEVLWQNKFPIFLVILIYGAKSGIYYFYFLFWNTYLNTVLNVITPSEACFKASCLTLASVALAPLCGYIADCLGRKIIPIGAFLSITMLVANGIALYSFNSAPTWLMAITAFTIVLLDVPLVILMLKLFNVGDRYRSLSIGHAIGTTIFSSVTPAIAIWFWQKFHHPIAPLVYGVFLILMGMFAASLAKIKDDPTIIPESL